MGRLPAGAEAMAGAFAHEPLDLPLESLDRQPRAGEVSITELLACVERSVSQRRTAVPECTSSTARARAASPRAGVHGSWTGRGAQGLRLPVFQGFEGRPSTP